MDGNGCVSECLSDAILVHRLWTVEKDVWRLIFNVRDNDTIRHHMTESPGVIGLLATEVQKTKQGRKKSIRRKEKQPPNTLKNKNRARKERNRNPTKKTKAKRRKKTPK